MKNWGYVTCGSPPGVPSAYSSTALGTTAWRDGWIIAYTLLDNAFTAIEDWVAAQPLADSWDASFLHRKLDEFAER